MDIEMNCMERQMERFDDLLNRIPTWFRNTNLVLLLNKKDLFVEKIRKRPINTCPLFADYDGPMDSVEQSIEYIRNVFLSRTDRIVNSYIVNGIDKTDVEVVCQDLFV